MFKSLFLYIDVMYRLLNYMYTGYFIKTFYTQTYTHMYICIFFLPDDCSVKTA